MQGHPFIGLPDDLAAVLGFVSAIEQGNADGRLLEQHRRMAIDQPCIELVAAAIGGHHHHIFNMDTGGGQFLEPETAIIRG